MSFLPEFPYFLWTTDDGEHCWVRIKDTGEKTEVSREVFRELRREEDKIKKLKEELNPTAGDDAIGFYEINHALSLDIADSDTTSNITPSWLVSRNNPESESIAAELERQLLLVLTERQRDCYCSCIIRGESKIDYAKRTGISASRVTEIFMQIARKLKKLESPS